MKHRVLNNYVVTPLLAAVLFMTGLAQAETTSSATIWAESQSASFSRFLYRLSTSLRYDLNINLAYEEDTETDFRTALRDAAASNSLPTLAIMTLPMLVELLPELPVVPFPIAFLPEEISAEALEATIIDGEVYALPFHDGNHKLLYFNKKLIDGPIDSLDQLLAAHEQIRHNGADTIIWDYERMDTLCELLPCTVGNRLSSNDTSRSLKIVNQLFEEEIASNLCSEECSEPGCAHQCMIDLFYGDNVAYMIADDGEISGALDHLGKNLGVAPVPALGNERTTHYRFPTVLVFFEESFTSANRNTTIQVAHYLVNRVNQKRMFADSVLIPVNESYLYTLYDHLIPQTVEADSVYIMQNNTEMLFPDNPAIRLRTGTTLDILNRYLTNGFNSEEDAAEALIEAANF